MNKTAIVTALQAFTHNGVRYARGEVRTVPVLDALALAQSGKVSLTKPAGRKDLRAAAAPKRGTYHRRDLVAEP